MNYTPRGPLRQVTTLASLIAVAILAWSPVAAVAEDIIFTIDHGLSSATWSGSDDVYGPYQPQSPGSLTSGVTGHFLVRFDPLAGTPATLQFVGGHGFYQIDSPHSGSPGPGAVPGSASANYAATTAGGQSYFAVRDLIWDFNSAPIAGSGGVYAANQTDFTVSSGGMDAVHPVAAFHENFVGSSDNVTGGNWVLAESSPGSGDWTLTLAGGYYTYGYDLGGPYSGTFTHSVTAVSHAHFGAANVDTVAPAATVAQALGGAGTTGGVSAQFSQPTSGGTFTVQQIPDTTGLSSASIAAAEANPIFALSTGVLDLNPQIWSVDFSGSLNGGFATLVFNYDPSLLPPGLDQSTLGIWHFSSLANDWQFGGTVDTLAHTITYVADSFSPFTLGVAVPEPSSLVLAAAGAVALGHAGSKRVRARRRTG